MTTRVDFYLLSSNTPDARYQALCRIVEKAYQHKQKSYVYCKDKAEAEYIERLLWTFKECSFLPHKLSSDEKATEAPVIIGHPPAKSLSPINEILLNLTPTVPDFYLQFNRIIEIVPADESSRAQSRENYRFYRAQQCELHSHQLG